MYLVIGAGLSGATVARCLADSGKCVLVMEQRNHIGGNCYDFVDADTGIRMCRYGAHIFHTNNQRVWDFVQRFSEWVRWEHEVVSRVGDTLVPFPVNCTTVNMLCGENISTEEEMDDWLAKSLYRGPINNSRDMALSRVGEKLYERLVRPYTFKQWAKYPEELDAEVLARIPFRNNFDTRYFQDKYQALPRHGYTAFFDNMLCHPLIEVRLGTEYVRGQHCYEGIIYTGPIDAYFADTLPTKLEYRSIDFHVERHFNVPFFQENSVVNYPGEEVPWTRIVEHKHFLHQSSPHTIVVRETTNDEGPPYYPIPNKRNRDLYARFQELAKKEEEERNVHFIGRLANYKYFNMDQAILNALQCADQLLLREKN